MAAYNTDADAFNAKLLVAQVDFNGAEVRVFGDQENLVFFFAVL
jgi:hypothetical protein